ncbi:MAG: SDR family NAD(P)-dependent oxidoreductase [Planctomycetales bacterium]|nr:SDR family NAD(P)-dependent oxidoreductase [Planctomycetales bacterium]
MSRASQALVAAVTAGAVYSASRKLQAKLGYRFAGRNVFITGGSRGLGFVLARQLMIEGARVAICARDERELREAQQRLVQDPRISEGTPLLALAADVTDADAMRRAVNQVTEVLGPIDVLINNAGIIQVGPVETLTLEDFHEAMNINYWGAVHTTLAVLPGMLQRGAGRIVNIASIGGRVAIPHLLAYSASKFALVGFSDGLRTELSRHGIVVSTICPGVMRTGSARHAQYKGWHDQEQSWFGIGSALPLATIGAERAARQILDACRRGDAHVVLSLPARIAALANGVAPGWMTMFMRGMNGLLPNAPGELREGSLGREARTGFRSESTWSPSWFTTLADRAAEANNELYET